MWLIVGLGNPDEKYEWTRHNCGFMVIDEIARRIGRSLKLTSCQALNLQTKIGDQEVLLVKPQTYMNLSGVAVAALKEKHGVEDASSVLVLSDDFALPFGKIRIRPSGSAGGHNGLKSIIARLGTQQFPRLRLGIMPDHPIDDYEDFVLSRFPRSDRSEVENMISRAADAVEVILTKGIAQAMASYN
jgi:peptidyl-tRNA hydrolase, PTH1 family